MSSNTGVRVIAAMEHGSHAVVDANVPAQPVAGERRVRLSEVAQDRALGNLSANDALAQSGATDFDYLFPQLPGNPDNLLPNGDPATVDATVEALNALGNAMIEQDPPAPRQTPIPPIHTYWGQFVDHDLTAATDNDDVFSISANPAPVPPGTVVNGLKNGRNPALNLDSVYGNGPFAPQQNGQVRVPYLPNDPAKLDIGELADFEDRTKVIAPAGDRARDLPRKEGTAQIGDKRNDENLVVAQLHVAFLRFHNNAVDWVRAYEPERRGVGDVFARARELTRWTYQWLCVHDYLTTVLSPGVLDEVLVNEDDLLGRQGRATPYMPLEFSAAAFRFGHSMVRGEYDWNSNFGAPGNILETSTLGLLFEFTGAGGFNGQQERRLPDNWPAEWKRFVEVPTSSAIRSARPIDTFLAEPLRNMQNQLVGTTEEQNPTSDLAKLLMHLARRNLLRGYILSVPTGQAVAGALGIDPLTKEEMVENLDPGVLKALEDGEFLERTPLWFYVLRESEVRTNGDSLGPAGSHIVAETIIGQLRHDPRSYLNQTAWTPAAGVRLLDGSPITSIADFLDFAGVLT